MIWDKGIVLTVKVRFDVIISNSQKFWYSKIKNNVKGGREYEVKKRYHKYCSDISCCCRGLKCESGKGAGK